MGEVYTKEQVDEVITHLSTSAKNYIDRGDETQEVLGYLSEPDFRNSKTVHFSSPESGADTREVPITTKTSANIVGIQAYYNSGDIGLVFDSFSVDAADGFDIGGVRFEPEGVVVDIVNIGANAQEQTIAIVVEERMFVGRTDF